MTRRRFSWSVAAIALALASGGCDRASCADDVAKAEATVHTDRRWTGDDLPGIGEYVDVHWQQRASGDPCSRAPGPTDWQYQGLVRLRPAQAEALLKAYEWTAMSPAQMWPALQPLVPDGVAWRHSEDYAEALAQKPRAGTVYLSPDDALLYFAVHDR